ncbi:hypothetical protein GCM10028796_07240 [Ramlibacter monticola]|uniref:DUF4136 domain-containing protein n=1 Tax=Ramlibacter monticola TaxID=1926872 RepID=A0A936YS32_9BURK|nr:DUF4136 domain-containing protein [Ramlibacter monticola]MBL0389585.1 DUF4136 domain-containing protein [Ramlibacter monticola]
MNRLRRRRLLGLSMAAMLAACAAPPPSATVQVFTLPAQLPPGTPYRHERLPSQAARPDQAMLEGVADAVLARAGLRRDEANPRLAIQVTVSQDAVAYGPAWGFPSVGVGIGGSSWGGGSVGIGLNFPIGGTAVYPSQRVDVLLRDVANGQVVFQSQASSNSGANAAILLEVALRDFQNVPPGMRLVPLAGPVGY